jgi:hypothetical protein
MPMRSWNFARAAPRDFRGKNVRIRVRPYRVHPRHRSVSNPDKKLPQKKTPRKSSEKNAAQKYRSGVDHRFSKR